MYSPAFPTTPRLYIPLNPPSKGDLPVLLNSLSTGTCTGLNGDLPVLSECVFGTLSENGIFGGT